MRRVRAGTDGGAAVSMRAVRMRAAHRASDVAVHAGCVDRLIVARRAIRDGWAREGVGGGGGTTDGNFNFGRRTADAVGGDVGVSRSMR